MNSSPFSKIQIETLPDVRFILDNVNQYSYQILLEILEKTGSAAKNHPEDVVNLAAKVSSVLFPWL